jgi:hypothetical protein
MSAELLVEELKKTGTCSKVVVVESSGGCSLIYCGNEDGILIAVASYYDWVYAKAAAEGSLKPHMWHCSEVFYTPYGVYSFAKSVEELARKIAEKKPIVYAQMRLALERLAEMEE